MDKRNDQCEVCRKNDAAILDDKAKGYCPKCWLARCEDMTTDRRRRPELREAVEQAMGVNVTVTTGPAFGGERTTVRRQHVPVTVRRVEAWAV
ncbi:MAG: hypothetical protein WBG86_17930 [Polyangiales bacterium]